MEEAAAIEVLFHRIISSNALFPPSMNLFLSKRLELYKGIPTILQNWEYLENSKSVIKPLDSSLTVKELSIKEVHISVVVSDSDDCTIKTPNDPNSIRVMKDNWENAWYIYNNSLCPMPLLRKAQVLAVQNVLQFIIFLGQAYAGSVFHKCRVTDARRVDQSGTGFTMQKDNPGPSEGDSTSSTISISVRPKLPHGRSSLL